MINTGFTFILASASPRRKALLASIGLSPDLILPADIDETPQKGENPRSYAIRMSQEKGRKIASQQTKACYIISADTVVSLGRRILPKATNRDIARTCIHKLSGRRHNVYTSVTLIKKNSQELSLTQRCAKTVVTFSHMDTNQKNWLLNAGDWEGKAGGYALQGFAARFIRFVNGSPSNVIGLPLFETAQLLRGISGNPLSL